MGKRSRATRSAIKQYLRKQGWSENEFGELIKKTTKAEARRVLARRILVTAFEKEIVDGMIKTVVEEIHEVEDARFIRELTEALEVRT